MAENKKIKKCPVSLQPDIENLLQDLTPDDFASASSCLLEIFLDFSFPISVLFTNLILSI